MNYRKMGRTGLKVSALCLGTMQFGWSADEDASQVIMDAFVEAGGNFLDTADIYSAWVPGNPGGVSEEIIGRWMKARNNRHQLVVATKSRASMGKSPNDAGLSRRHLMDAVDASLRRLQVDFIDLYQAHSFDPETPIEETMRAYEDIIRAGKVRYIGASNYPAWRLMESLWTSDRLNIARYDTLQPNYSLAKRIEFDRELAAVCEKYEIGVIPYSPLAAGFLTGKYQRDNLEPAGSARTSAVKGNFATPQNWDILDEVKAIASELNTNPGAVALAWLFTKKYITAPIIGANNTAQLNESLAAVELVLTPEQVARLEKVSSEEYAKKFAVTA